MTTRISTNIWKQPPDFMADPVITGQLYSDEPYIDLKSSSDEVAEIAADYVGSYVYIDGENVLMDIGDPYTFVLHFHRALHGIVAWADPAEETGGVMLEGLNKYYKDEGISPLNFHCPHRQECSARYPESFIEARAGYVGPLYEERHLPRLLFLSLDPGALPPSPAKRTVSYVRKEVSKAIPENPHWKYTHEMAYKLLRQFKPDLKPHGQYDKTHTDLDLRPSSYFAHVNCVKCRQKSDSRKQADQLLFSNCSRYIHGELEVLNPDIIVTQGRKAQEAIQRKFIVREREVKDVTVPDYKRLAHYETGFIELGPSKRTVLWIQTHHPTDYGRFHPQSIHVWPQYEKRVGRFWETLKAG